MEPVNHDGLRCSVGEGDWLIARASLHEPVGVVADGGRRCWRDGGDLCAAVLPYLPFEADIDLAELEAVSWSRNCRAGARTGRSPR